jgi:rod shape determining protein RodA
MAKKAPSHLMRIDWILLAAAVALVILGLFSLFSLARNGVIDVAMPLKQVAFLAAGVVIAISVSFLNVRIFQRYGWSVVALYCLALAALAGLFIFGRVIRGNRAWYGFLGFGIAPVEFAKIVLLVLLAKFFSDRHRDLYTVKHILTSFCYSAAMAVPVALQPDLGSALVLFSLWLGVLLFTGVRFRWVLAIFLCVALAVCAGWKYGLKDYQKDRIMAFANPSAQSRGYAYNAIQSKIAIGSGGFWGKGMGEGTQTAGKFLPESSTDFIFSAIAEENGFFGIAILLAVFVLLWYRILRIGWRAAHNFGRIFAFGLAWLVAVHFFINTGMNLGMLPVIGLPLPFVSYGGSHVLAGFFGIGILLAISAQMPDQKERSSLLT